MLTDQQATLIDDALRRSRFTEDERQETLYLILRALAAGTMIDDLVRYARVTARYVRMSARRMAATRRTNPYGKPPGKWAQPAPQLARLVARQELERTPARSVAGAMGLTIPPIPRIERVRAWRSRRLNT